MAHALDQLATDLAQLDRQHAAEHAAMVERHAQERATVLARAQGEKIPAPPAPGLLDDLLRPKEAQRAFRLAKSVLFRLGAAHPISEPNGFCFVDGRGVQLFSKSRLEAFLADHPRRRQRC